MALNEHNPGASGGAERDPLLDRAYRGAATEEPPARLDAAILAAVRREAGASPRPLGAALRTWRIPMSIAAVLVLSVSLVTLMREEGDVSIEPPPPAAVAPPATQPRSAVERDTREQPLRKLARAPGAALDSASQPAPAVPQEARKAPEAAQAPALRDDVTGAESAEHSAPQMAAKPAPEARRERAVSGVGRIATEDPSPVWRGYEQEPPRRWLERIEELRRLGQKAEADAMLAEFKRRFPGHPLPPELR